MRVLVSPFALAIALGLPWLAACRSGFDRLPDMPDAAPDATPLPVLPCGAPPQFQMTAGMTALGAAAGDAGYYAFALDAAGGVHGFSYEFAGDQLVARAVDVPVFSGATGTIGAIDTGDGVLAEISYGRPDPTGTALVSLDGQLAPRGAPEMHPAWYARDGAIARAADGTLALLGGQPSSDVATKLVSAAGRDLGTPHVVIDGAEGVGFATILPSAAGFLVTWAASTPSPNQARAEVLDKKLAITVPAATINPGATFDATLPRAAYAAAADRYLFAWYDKPPTGGDELWISLRDARLVEITRVLLARHGLAPRLAAGKDGFLVVWQDSSVPSGLVAARVRFDGSHDALSIDGHGGLQVGWDVVTRAGQPAVVWLEGGAAPGLWLNALCN